MKMHTVLLIEDDPEDVQVIREILEKSRGIVVINTDSAQQGIHMLETMTIDLAIIDLNLGLAHQTGLNVLQYIKQTPRTSTIPAVIFSSTFRQEEWNRCWRMGANACYKKQVNPDLFDETVKLIRKGFLEFLQFPTRLN